MDTVANQFRITNLFLVDSDFCRKAAISHCLSDTPIHVEPFEQAQDLVDYWSLGGLLLVHDHEDSVREVLTLMAGSGNWLPVIGYAENPSPRNVAHAVLDGAIDYIGWPFTGEEIAEVIATAETRSKTFGPAKLREAEARSRLGCLTNRERQVLVDVAKGMSTRAIAEKLGISMRTVEGHRANMLYRMGISGTAQDIRIAIIAALID